MISCSLFVFSKELTISFCRLSISLIFKDDNKENEEIFITSAFVQISDTITGQTTIFSPSPDTTEKGYYFNSTFAPLPEHHYELEIAADDLPVLNGETTVPVKPAIVPQSLSITDRKVRFDLVLTTDTYQYNIYLFFGDNYLEKQLPNYQTGFKKVEFNIYYSRGISREDDLITLGLEKGILTRSGAWYKYQNEKIGQGLENAGNYLKEHPKVAQEIRKQIFETS